MPVIYDGLNGKRVKCETHNCDLSVAACGARHQAPEGKVGEIDPFRFCRVCDTGALAAQGLREVPPEDRCSMPGCPFEKVRAGWCRRHQSPELRSLDLRNWHRRQDIQAEREGSFRGHSLAKRKVLAVLLAGGAMGPTSIGLGCGQAIRQAGAWATPRLRQLCEDGLVRKTADRGYYGLTPKGREVAEASGLELPGPE